MLTIEEYIARRKREDQINEFSYDEKMENMKTCVNYVFEYFNQYLDPSQLSETTVLNNERLEKYKKTLVHYELDIQEWLVNVYDDHDKQLNRSIINYLKSNDLFLLCYTDKEFRGLSYECYAYLIKKSPFVKDQTELLFMFIKDQHRIQSTPSGYHQNIFISEEINQWIEKTWEKYKVNLMLFASDWVSRFFDNEEQWPVKHRIKSNETWRKYEYDIKQKSNLFNLNPLYRRISGIPFIKGKKQHLEILLMYFWLHDIEGDEEDYWQEYINNVL